VTGPRLWRTLAKRFDALKLRERMLVTTATLVVLLALFNVLALRGLEARRQALAAQLSDIGSQDQSMSGAASAAVGTSSVVADVERSRDLGKTLDRVTARLRSQSAGLIPPQRMSEVIHDVLARQQGVELISLRSLPPYPLLAGAPAAEATDGQAVSAATLPAQSDSSSPPAQGPYVHAMVLVLQGSYLNVLEYLQALQQLRWHFYWQSLQLDVTQYPTTRVTVRLGTLSMNQEWIDL
jgi:MSHA biogenesis protein MshJ